MDLYASGSAGILWTHFIRVSQYKYQQEVLKDKLTVTLSMNDMFYTNKNNFTIKQGSVDAYGYRLADTRRFGVNLRYNFGIRKKEENNNPLNMEAPAN